MSTDEIAKLSRHLEAYRHKAEAMRGTPFAAAYAEAAQQIEAKIARLNAESDAQQQTDSSSDKPPDLASS